MLERRQGRSYVRVAKSPLSPEIDVEYVLTERGLEAATASSAEVFLGLDPALVDLSEALG